MSQLPAKCAPCKKGTPALTHEESLKLKSEVPGWTLDHAHLRRTWTLKDFRKALAWVNRVGMLAEEEGHHPDFHITGWNKVELVLSTHDVGGLSLNDYVLARKINELAARDGSA